MKQLSNNLQDLKMSLENNNNNLGENAKNIIPNKFIGLDILFIG